MVEISNQPIQCFPIHFTFSQLTKDQQQVDIASFYYIANQKNSPIISQNQFGMPFFKYFRYQWHMINIEQTFAVPIAKQFLYDSFKMFIHTVNIESILNDDVLILILQFAMLFSPVDITDIPLPRRMLNRPGKWTIKTRTFMLFTFFNMRFNRRLKEPWFIIRRLKEHCFLDSL